MSDTIHLQRASEAYAERLLARLAPERADFSRERVRNLLAVAWLEGNREQLTAIGAKLDDLLARSA